MIKSRYVYNFSTEEWQNGRSFMLFEVACLPAGNQVRLLLNKAIADYEAGQFSYDGATFVKERSSSLFEVAAFIHDWRNAMGYVGKEVDQEMFDIMNILNYETPLVFWRFFLTRFTFINVYRHKIMHTFAASVPMDLYIKPTLNFYLEQHLNN